jgi:hypothetical protein
MPSLIAKDHGVVCAPVGAGALLDPSFFWCILSACQSDTQYGPCKHTVLNDQINYLCMILHVQSYFCRFSPSFRNSFRPQLAKGKKHCDVACVEPSPDHTVVAYSVDYTGYETYDIYFKVDEKP